jgi:hypothetical protein
MAEDRTNQIRVILFSLPIGLTFHRLHNNQSAFPQNLVLKVILTRLLLSRSPQKSICGFKEQLPSAHLSATSRVSNLRPLNHEADTRPLHHCVPHVERNERQYSSPQNQCCKFANIPQLKHSIREMTDLGSWRK